MLPVDVDRVRCLLILLSFCSTNNALGVSVGVCSWVVVAGVPRYILVSSFSWWLGVSAADMVFLKWPAGVEACRVLQCSAGLVFVDVAFPLLFSSLTYVSAACLFVVCKSMWPSLLHPSVS